MSENRSAKTPWGMVIMLGSLTAMGPLATDMYLPSLPTIGEDLNASVLQTTTTISAFMLGMGVGQMVYGPASDRLGRRTPLIFGTLLYVIASLSCMLAASPDMLIGSRLIQGLGACSGGVVARAIVRDRFNHTESARMLSLMSLIQGLAPIFAPSLGGLLLIFGGWRLCFGVMAAAGLMMTISIILRLQDSRSSETIAHARTENALQAYVALIRERRVLGYVLGAAFNGGVLFTYVASSSELIIHIYGISPSIFALIFGAIGVGMIVGSQINRILLRHWSPDTVLARAGLVGVGVAAVLVLAAVTGFGGRWTVIPLLFCLMASFGFMQSNAMAGALSIDPRRAGSISALTGGMSSGVGAGAAMLAAAMHDGTPRPMAVIMLLSLTLSILSLRLLAFPKRGRGILA